MLHTSHEPSGNDKKRVVEAIEEHPDGKVEDMWACLFILQSITRRRCDDNRQSAHNQGEKRQKDAGTAVDLSVNYVCTKTTYVCSL